MWGFFFLMSDLICKFIPWIHFFSCLNMQFKNWQWFMFSAFSFWYYILMLMARISNLSGLVSWRIANIVIVRPVAIVFIHFLFPNLTVALMYSIYFPWMRFFIWVTWSIVNTQVSIVFSRGFSDSAPLWTLFWETMTIWLKKNLKQDCWIG